MKKTKTKKKTKNSALLLWILPFLFLGCFILLNDFITALLINNGALYINFNTSIYSFFSTGLFILDILIFCICSKKISGLNDEFEAVSAESNLNAQKIAGRCIILTSTIFILAMSFFFLSRYSRLEADSEALTQYTLFSEPVTICDYDDVSEIEVYLEWEHRGKHDNGYTTIIKLKTDDDVYKLSSRGFQDDFYLIRAFLNLFDEDIITVDKTYSDETEDIFGYDYFPEIFEEIYGI